MVLGSRKLKYFHDFPLFRERRIIASQIALFFFFGCLLLNVKNFELLRFLDLLNRKNMQLIDVKQRIRKLFCIGVLQIDRKNLFKNSMGRSILSLMLFSFFHDRVTYCCHNLLATCCTKIGPLSFE